MKILSYVISGMLLCSCSEPGKFGDNGEDILAITAMSKARRRPLMQEMQLILLSILLRTGF